MDPETFRCAASWGGAPTPLVRALPFWTGIPLAGLFACVVGLPLAWVLDVIPLFTLVPALLVGVALVEVTSRAHLRRAGLEVVADQDAVELRSRWGTQRFPVAATRARVEVREWTSPKTTGHNLWTVLVLEHDGQAVVVGAEGGAGPRVATTGRPAFVIEPASLVRVAARFGLTVPA